MNTLITGLLIYNRLEERERALAAFQFAVPLFLIDQNK